jgi:hypothetical protein
MAIDYLILEGRTGESPSADGAKMELKMSRRSAIRVADTGGDYSEGASRRTIFSLALAATTTGIAAGNIVGAAAAAATQFALFNPVGSGKDLHLLKFGMGIISGTAPAGALFHGLFLTVPTVASIGGSIRNHYTGATPGGSVAIPQVLAAGSALTGGTAPVTLRCANFASTSTVAATPGDVAAIEIIDADIIVAPGMGWLPLNGSAGTSVLQSYSITWEEVSLPT